MLSRRGVSGGSKCAQTMHEPSGDDQSADSAEEGDDGALDDLLTKQSAARCADRAADGEFAAA